MHAPWRPPLQEQMGSMNCMAFLFYFWDFISVLFLLSLSYHKPSYLPLPTLLQTNGLFFISCYYMQMCICIYICVLKCNVLSPYNVACMYGVFCPGKILLFCSELYSVTCSPLYRFEACGLFHPVCHIHWYPLLISHLGTHVGKTLWI